MRKLDHRAVAAALRNPAGAESIADMALAESLDGQGWSTCVEHKLKGQVLPFCFGLVPAELRRVLKSRRVWNGPVDPETMDTRDFEVGAQPPNLDLVTRRFFQHGIAKIEIPNSPDIYADAVQIAVWPVCLPPVAVKFSLVAFEHVARAGRDRSDSMLTEIGKMIDAQAGESPWSDCSRCAALALRHRRWVYAIDPKIVGAIRARLWLPEHSQEAAELDIIVGRDGSLARIDADDHGPRHRGGAAFALINHPPGPPLRSRDLMLTLEPGTANLASVAFAS